MVLGQYHGVVRSWAIGGAVAVSCRIRGCGRTEARAEARGLRLESASDSPVEILDRRHARDRVHDGPGAALMLELLAPSRERHGPQEGARRFQRMGRLAHPG